MLLLLQEVETALQKCKAAAHQVQGEEQWQQGCLLCFKQVRYWAPLDAPGTYEENQWQEGCSSCFKQFEYWALLDAQT